jgi:hypothetical protein
MIGSGGFSAISRPITIKDACIYRFNYAQQVEVNVEGLLIEFLPGV